MVPRTIEWMPHSPSSEHPAVAADPLVSGLNPQQREAVLYRGPALLIVAGAGSGKTRVLTHRIAHLISTHDAWPSQILAITFTNKAANEMRERVGQLLGAAAEGMWISTFHSACVRILRREIAALGLGTSFTIYDTHDSRVLLKRLIKERHADVEGLTAAAAQHRISAWKNELRDPDDVSRELQPGDPTGEAVLDVYRAYDDALRRANALDFDDILVYTVHLLNGFPEVRRRYQQKWRHVLVDEYQDTNKAQYELIRALTTPAVEGQPVPALTVVGDSDQSIYAFRGADLRNIIDFDKDFPGTHVVLLEQNYRSTQRILDAANAVIARNYDRAAKHLWSSLGDGEPIEAFAGYSAHDEAQFVADEIARLHREGLDYRDIAVFYRTNAQTRALEEIFVRAGVPYRLVGGTKFYDRAEVKDALAYLVALVNPADELSVRRVLNVPRRGIGPTTESRLVHFAAEHGLTLPQALSQAKGIGLGPKVTQAMTSLGQALEDARRALSTERLDEVVHRFFEHIGLIEALRTSLDDQDHARAENLEEFEAQLTDYAEKNPDAQLIDFLTEVSLTAAADDLEDESGSVVLMTLHTAKGLEYPAVFVTGLEQGLLPHQMSIDEIGGIAEERRLFYVGLTRAQRRLYLSLAVNRTVFGQAQTHEPSQFLADIPDDLINWRQRPEDLMVSSLGSWGGSSRRSTPSLSPEVSSRRTQTPKRGGWASQVTAESLAKPMLQVSVGDRIRHASFGEGTVRELAGEGRKQVATIVFDGGARKKLVVALAPITLAE